MDPGPSLSTFATSGLNLAPTPRGPPGDALRLGFTPAEGPAGGNADGKTVCVMKSTREHVRVNESILRTGRET